MLLKFLNKKKIAIIILINSLTITTKKKLLYKYL